MNNSSISKIYENTNKYIEEENNMIKNKAKIQEQKLNKIIEEINDNNLDSSRESKENNIFIYNNNYNNNDYNYNNNAYNFNHYEYSYANIYSNNFPQDKDKKSVILRY